MAGATKIITNMRREFQLARSADRERMLTLENRIDELEKRLDKYDKPVNPKAKPKATQGKRPVPVPDRPEVMVAAGVGKDPR